MLTDVLVALAADWEGAFAGHKLVAVQIQPDLRVADLADEGALPEVAVAAIVVLQGRVRAQG